MLAEIPRSFKPSSPKKSLLRERLRDKRIRMGMNHIEFSIFHPVFADPEVQIERKPPENGRIQFLDSELAVFDVGSREGEDDVRPCERIQVGLERQLELFKLEIGPGKFPSPPAKFFPVV